jgi:hypothetical protein
MKFIKMIVVDPKEEPEFEKYMDSVVKKSEGSPQHLTWFKQSLKDGKVRYLNGVEQKIKPEDISKLMEN